MALPQKKLSKYPINKSTLSDEAALTIANNDHSLVINTSTIDYIRERTGKEIFQTQDARTQPRTRKPMEENSCWIKNRLTLSLCDYESSHVSKIPDNKQHEHCAVQHEHSIVGKFVDSSYDLQFDAQHRRKWMDRKMCTNRSVRPSKDTIG